MVALYRLVPLLGVLLLGAPVRAEEAGDTIAWSKDLPSAIAQAKQTGRILMICVNAKSVAGEAEESAAKGLREAIYKDPRIIKKSRAFVCALLTPEGTSDDYGELRALGIDGKIVSPQHIFVHPDGKQILRREQYWSHGRGAGGVQALLEMMADAEHKRSAAPAEPDASEVPEGAPPAEPPAPGAGASEERAVWIERLIQQVMETGGSSREAAIESLVRGDKDGDCVGLLVALLPEHKQDTDLLVTLIRGLGRDGLVLAALPVSEQLTHKDAAVRGNAAVSLEYIGCRDEKVIAALRKMADREKDEAIANHAYRALGRCGSNESKVRSLLLKQAGSAKSEYASYGACIGLAYFEGDKQAARGVEELLKRLGVPGSRRGGGQNAVKRSVVSWTLASIGDPASGAFVREELMAGLEHVQAVWVDGLLRFWDTVARVCEGEQGLMPGVENGVRGAVSFVKSIDLGRYGAESRHLMDEYRLGRESAGFTPQGDHLLHDERGG